VRKKRQGLLITFEGNEGCGKTTQIRLLYESLKKAGLRVFLTREPGGTAASDAIREILLDRKHKGLDGVTETLLYMASRAELVRKVILPQLRKGSIVLCDRWMDATIAYQGFGEGVDIDWIRSLGERATLGRSPDLSLFFDLPVEIGLERAGRRGAADRMQQKDRTFHRRVRQGYLWIARKEPRRFIWLKLSERQGVDEVRSLVWERVGHVL